MQRETVPETQHPLNQSTLLPARPQQGRSKPLTTQQPERWGRQGANVQGPALSEGGTGYSLYYISVFFTPEADIDNFHLPHILTVLG